MTASLTAPFALPGSSEVTQPAHQSGIPPKPEPKQEPSIEFQRGYKKGFEDAKAEVAAKTAKEAKAEVKPETKPLLRRDAAPSLPPLKSDKSV